MNSINNEKIVEEIRNRYIKQENSKIDQLRKLDAKVKTPANIFAYSFGVLASLVLGVGMCLAMKIIGNLMPLGIVIGLFGIAMIVGNYYLYRMILNSRKKKYSAEILRISDELLNKNN